MEDTMRCRSATLSLVLVLVLMITVLGTPAHAAKDLILSIEPLSAAKLGEYSGDVRIALGEVVDDGFAESPEFLGVGPQAAYSILLEETRAESVKSAISHLLEETKLAADSTAEATYILDVKIVRLRSFIHQTFGRFRLRSEVFIEFTFKQGDTVAGRVLACGNSQNKAQFASKKKVEATYQFGFDDALYKLVGSETFKRLVGEGWQPGSGSAVGGEYNIERIKRDRFYGPSDLIRAEIAKAKRTMETGTSHLSLQDFVLKDPKFKPKEAVDVDFACGYLPELVREHLNSFFPGAFETIERRKEWQEGEAAAVLTGDLFRFKIGSFMKRAMIGFGAGKDKLESMVVIKDGASGDELFKLNFKASNWGAGWQTKRGQIRDMADQLARDLAFFLVETMVENYTYPEDLEVRFDGIPYPEKAGP
jgi:hypothetical protein